MNKIKYHKTMYYFLAIVSCTFFFPPFSYPQMQKLKIAENNRFLIKEDGTPFVWIGETNWFFSQLPPSIIDSILNKRSAQGFTIMFISCRQKLYNGKGGTGSVSEPNEAWWNYLDEYIKKCEERNMYIGITLGWWGKTRQYSAEELYIYGKWAGNRYKNNNNVIWLTLGEAGGHKRKNTIPDEKLNALVKGIRDGDTGDKLLTVHADFRRGTSISNDAEIVDFNNWQTSQWCCIKDLPRKDNREWTVWEAISYDYNQLYNGKPKPTLDSEAWYEKNKDFCGATAYNIRRRAYFTIFAGAFGHTYGAGGMWDGLQKVDSCSGTALDALHYEGAEHIGYISNFLHAFGDDYLKLIPQQSIITEGNSSNYDTHIQAASANDYSFLLIYSASDAPYSVDLSNFSQKSLSYAWYNPRMHKIEHYKKLSIKATNKNQKFDPPGEIGAGNDWILIIGRKSFIKKLTSNL